LRTALEERIETEQKKSEEIEEQSNKKRSEMEAKVNELIQLINSKEEEKEAIARQVQSKDDEIQSLKSSVSSIEVKQKEETESVHKLLQLRDEELRKITQECTTKENLISELKNNLENLQSCLNTTSLDNESSVKLVRELNESISTRDFSIRDLKMQLFEIEKQNAEKDNQLKNVSSMKLKLETESQMRIDDLMEQLNLLEEVKHQEVSEMSLQVKTLESKVSVYGSEAKDSSSSQRELMKREEELLSRIKDLEMSETELMINNQTLKRQMDELKQSGPSTEPSTVTLSGNDSEDQIAFLNSIIADMHKKNKKLTKKVQTLESAPPIDFTQ